MVIPSATSSCWLLSEAFLYALQKLVSQGQAEKRLRGCGDRMRHVIHIISCAAGLISV